jgi:glycosyltransferase involved in cell wall biosynthesis
VAVPGWVDRETASDLLRAADIFVLPSFFGERGLMAAYRLVHKIWEPSSSK